MIHQNRYRLKAELNTGKFETHQYPHKEGCVSSWTVTSRNQLHLH